MPALARLAPITRARPLGRDAELALVADLAAAGTGTVVVVSAPAGMGRSALAACAADEACSAGYAVTAVEGTDPAAPACLARLHRPGAILVLDGLEHLSPVAARALLEAIEGAPRTWRLALMTLCPEVAPADLTERLARMASTGAILTLTLHALDSVSSAALIEAVGGPLVRLAPAAVDAVMGRSEGTPARLVEGARGLRTRRLTRHGRPGLEAAMDAATSATPVEAAHRGVPHPYRRRREVPRLVRTRVLVGWSRLQAGEIESALDIADETLPLARATRDASGAALAQSLAAVALAELGRPEEAGARLQRAVVAAQRAPSASAMASLAASHALLLMGHPSAAADCARQALAGIAGRVPSALHAHAGALLGLAAWRAGDLATASEAAEAVASAAEVHGAAALVGRGVRGLVAAERGDVALTRRLGGGLTSAQAPAHLAAWLGWMAARMDMSIGHPEAARARLRTVVRAMRAHGSVAGELVALADLVEAEASCGGIHAGLPRLRQLATVLPSPLHAELTARAQARAAELEGRHGDAVRLLEDATRQAPASPVERARTLERAGASTVATHQVARGLAQLADAVMLARGAGASRMEQDLLRRLGGGSASPQRQAFTGREREVAALVAEGLSNRLVAAVLGISPRTVEHHLARAMQKSGVPNRVRLAMWMAQQGDALDL